MRQKQEGKKMRNPNRIDEILKLISKIWHKNPDQRLCQLIGNCFINTSYHGQDLYYIEDDKLQELLTKYLKELKLVENFINRKE